jgi:hypothetical protein
MSASRQRGIGTERWRYGALLLGSVCRGHSMPGKHCVRSRHAEDSRTHPTCKPGRGIPPPLNTHTHTHAHTDTHTHTPTHTHTLTATARNRVAGVRILTLSLMNLPTRLCTLQLHVPIVAYKFKLTHRSGVISCTAGEQTASYWGCWPNNAMLQTVLTTAGGQVVVPASPLFIPFLSCLVFHWRHRLSSVTSFGGKHGGVGAHAVASRCITVFMLIHCCFQLILSRVHPQ